MIIDLGINKQNFDIKERDIVVYEIESGIIYTVAVSYDHEAELYKIINLETLSIFSEHLEDIFQINKFFNSNSRKILKVISHSKVKLTLEEDN